jgi:hypothetical protein
MASQLSVDQDGTHDVQIYGRFLFRGYTPTNTPDAEKRV